MQRKRAGGHIENVSADHVGRHQVRGALHALKRQAEDARDGFHGERLPHARHAFHQRVAAAHQHQQQLIHNGALPHNHFRKFTANMRCQARQVFHGQSFSCFFFFSPNCTSYFSSFCINSSASDGGIHCARLAESARCSGSRNESSFSPSRPRTASSSNALGIAIGERSCRANVPRERWYTAATTAGSACARWYRPPSVSTNSSGARRVATAGIIIGPLRLLKVESTASPRTANWSSPQGTGVFWKYAHKLARWPWKYSSQ